MCLTEKVWWIDQGEASLQNSVKKGKNLIHVNIRMIEMVLLYPTLSFEVDS